MAKHYIVRVAMTAVAVVREDVVCGARIETGTCESMLIGEPGLEDV